MLPPRRTEERVTGTRGDRSRPVSPHPEGSHHSEVTSTTLGSSVLPESTWTHPGRPTDPTPTRRALARGSLDRSLRALPSVAVFLFRCE